ncbi:hypothetical protein AUJ95_09415 [Candidatus Desantisbacteria bacterium CG2_30_40_21]|uniref:DUF7948 domain-containing protein n=5 Tax=unclassified Candidatus Desantisiibacteriota TaxID=3106372 RepID=A0A2M7JCQ2_9BACT|nr:MAG: hypothetical protein AUJ95_09415 [Candidatus Desantisbacteria bacterium CG2_30_40_21]PIP39727.1 MAG: hypothetical protein COX18_09145 [Candidatus Desantisbacteria bacterium CG23_combo_of_CG06-09_8_20_14_all_40_23]PIX17161.1 MAG: hypothetical protein COZ71_04775 [Candidatus Desantisbacteria bacterium CG_4_8_14_3_um_filter_40_12]PIY20118.1 MAG: hypothetical protein COZ13_01785 [Candidatus Desantisbacteria bacterium CG_4_10_14_3_um_filter_40_18]PJB28129.1 MAG: hypothetical protein CO110_10
MKKILGAIGVFVVLVLGLGVNGWCQEDMAKYLNARLPFIENQGQAGEGIAFYAQTFFGKVGITKEGEILYHLSEHKAQNTRHRTQGPDTKHQTPDTRGIVLSESLIGAKDFQIEGRERAETGVNYFIGGKENWRSGVPSYNIVSLGEVYPKTTAFLKAYGNNVEKLFCIEKEGDPKNIILEIEGAENATIEPSGDLLLKTELGDVSFKKPFAYQDIEGEKKRYL